MSCVIHLRFFNHYITVSMTSYVDMGHKVLFGVILVRFRPLRNDNLMDESSRNHNVTVLMTSYVDMGHKVLFRVNLIRFRPLRND